MIESPLLIGISVLVFLTISLVLVVLLDVADFLIVTAKIIFLCASGVAFWGALVHHSYTEYFVWVMYAVGMTLIVCMAVRFFSKRFGISDPAKEKRTSTTH